MIPKPPEGGRCERHTYMGSRKMPKVLAMVWRRWLSRNSIDFMIGLNKADDKLKKILVGEELQEITSALEHFENEYIRKGFTSLRNWCKKSVANSAWTTSKPTLRSRAPSSLRLLLAAWSELWLLLWLLSKLWLFDKWLKYARKRTSSRRPSAHKSPATRK